MGMYYQNHGIAKQFGGGINQSVLDRIDSLESESQSLKTELDQTRRELQELKSARATQNTYGLSKISGSSSVTTDDGLVLSTKEKNASISGTLANQILQAKNEANRIKVHRVEIMANFVDGRAFFNYNIKEHGFSGVSGVFANLVATNDTCAVSITNGIVENYGIVIEILRGTYTTERKAWVTYVGI